MHPLPLDLEGDFGGLASPGQGEVSGVPGDCRRFSAVRLLWRRGPLSGLGGAAGAGDVQGVEQSLAVPSPLRGWFPDSGDPLIVLIGFRGPLPLPRARSRQGATMLRLVRIDIRDATAHQILGLAISHSVREHGCLSWRFSKDGSEGFGPQSQLAQFAEHTLSSGTCGGDDEGGDGPLSNITHPVHHEHHDDLRRCIPSAWSRPGMPQ
jgi:hypothetical protein